MSLYGQNVTIGGVACGLVMRGGSNGRYLAVFTAGNGALLALLLAAVWLAPV